MPHLSVVPVPEGRSREECVEIKKEREQELRLMMKRLEAKYAALQVVPVISKLGTQRVSIVVVSEVSLGIDWAHKKAQVCWASASDCRTAKMMLSAHSSIRMSYLIRLPRRTCLGGTVD